MLVIIPDEDIMLVIEKVLVGFLMKLDNSLGSVCVSLKLLNTSA